MKTIVISYSLTGNNESLAHSIAETIGAKHVRITEAKRRTTGTIILDLIFKRSPHVHFPFEEAKQYDLFLFVGPVWIGEIATPFRGCFKQLRPNIEKYVFISISGGADGPNPKIAGELKKRLRKEPLSVIDLHIADLLPSEPKPARSDTSAYRISDSDTHRLTDSAITILDEFVQKKRRPTNAIPFLPQ